MTTVEVPTCMTWKDIAAFVGCGRAKALTIINACPYSKPINDQNERRVLASDFVQWFRSVKDFRNVG